MAAITIHGRTREDFYTGQARYELITEVKRLPESLSLSNGDIGTQKLWISSQNRGGCCYDWFELFEGKPWLFQQIAHFANTGELLRRLRSVRFMEVVLRASR